ncbi:formylglycine-generating enzyme family protein [Aquabacter sp. CN5-332]|uniref:formylglycine-generating enzyme family protein n=1 Tax=Aquabacter sp. CN5-332 TaxID=3156608 RepID=UPI0032B59746
MRLALAMAGVMGFVPTAFGQAQDRVVLGPLAIDRTEVTIAAFGRFLAARGQRTTAEESGGGFEFEGGWVRQPGWTYLAPSGTPGAPGDPAVHVTWVEARDYCAFVGGRLPTAAEWRQAAYTEMRETPPSGYERGRTYAFPVGDDPAGMNLSTGDAWPRHAPAGVTRQGVNGLYDMGGNVWEWLADRRGGEALTAGGSWWYGADQTRAASM